MKVLRWVLLSLALLCAIVLVLWAGFGVTLIIPFANTISWLGVPLFLLLFFLLSLRRKPNKRRTLPILGMLLCAAAIVFSIFPMGLGLLFCSNDNFGTIRTNPNGRQQIVVISSFGYYDVYPCYLGCFYIKSEGTVSMKPIEQIEWSENSVAVFIDTGEFGNSWERYDYIAREWKWVTP